MKNYKKFAALLLAAAMTAGMSAVPAMAAAQDYTVTIGSSTGNREDISGHTFKAYQIFTGTQAATGGALGNIEWGNGVDGSALLAAVKSDGTIGSDFADAASAEDVANVLSGYENDSTKARAFAAVANAHVAGDGETLSTASTTALPVGYYLLVDTTSVDGRDEVVNVSVLALTNNINVTSKVEKPDVEKKVGENVKYPNKGTEKDTRVDAEVGETFNDTADYSIGDNIPFEFLSKVPDMSAYVNAYEYKFTDTMSDGLDFNNDVKVYVGATEVASTSYAVAVTGNDFTVTIPDLDAIADAGDILKVTFSGKLNANAVIGAKGNPNEVYLEYSNTPNGEGLGKTKEDKVIVFTYELDVNKVNEKNEALEGAKFKLFNADKTKVAEIGTNGKITGFVDVEEDADGNVTNGTEVEAVKVGDNYTAGFAGLDDGTYTLVETTTPAGYNTIEDKTIVIAANTDNGQASSLQLGSLTIKVDNGTAENGDITTGKVTTTIQNNSGSTLPSTGGMGTTIFYVIGAVLVLAAVIIIVSRKKVSRQ